MTNEEVITYLTQADKTVGKEIKTKTAEAIEIGIKAVKQESEALQFANWVAEEIFDENWEYNQDAFAELACRKLAKLGIVTRMGDEWEWIEPHTESENRE